MEADLMSLTEQFRPESLIRVERWYIFKPEIPIWVNFWEGLAMEDVGILYGHSVHFTATWYICPFGVFYGHLV
jgi:hypothetical protein